MKKDSFVKGTIIASASIILVKVIGALYNIPFYSIIGPEGGSLYTYGYTIYSLFLNISTAGIPIAISKIISEYNSLGLYEAKERAFSLGKKIIYIISILSFFILFVFSKEIAFLYKGSLVGGCSINDISLIIKSVSFCLLIIPMLSLLRGYLQGHKFITPSSTSQLIEQVARISFVLMSSYIAINLLHTKVSIGVSLAVLGAFFAGLVTYFYLVYKINSNKNKFMLEKINKKDNISNKEIIKKIISYSIPFIIMVIAIDIYNITDVTLILRGLTKVGYTTTEAELIASIIATWGSKLIIIINSFATGISMSLMPHMVSSNALKDNTKINKIINQSFSIILSVSFPLAIFICIFSHNVYNIFYGNSLYGPNILKLLIFISIFSSMDMIMSTILHGLNRFKLIYISMLLGFFTNACLDIPLIYLFNYIGIPAYYGTISATIIGYSLSLTIAFTFLIRKHKVNFKPLYNNIKKLVLPIILVTIIAFITHKIININTLSRLLQSLIICLYLVIFGSIYIFILYKNKGVYSIFGESIINKIIKIFKKND
ncbi:MAG: oligosaccharide flippase family protein [Bacilli bacterium]